MLCHPDDLASPRFGNWADDFATYDDACRFYGADTPANIEAEAAEFNAQSWIEVQDDMEARGGPALRIIYPDDEIPF